MRGGDRARDADRLGAHDHHPERRGEEVDDVGPREVRDGRIREGGGQVADDVDAAAGQVEQRGDGDRQHEYDERAWNLRCDPAERDEQDDARGADRDRPAVRVADVAEQRPQPLEERPARVVESEHLRELTDGDEQPQPEEEAGHHRLGDQVHDAAESKQSGYDQHGAGDEREPGGKGSEADRVAVCERADRRGRQRRGRRRRADDERPRGTEEGVGEQRPGRRHQPGRGW